MEQTTRMDLQALWSRIDQLERLVLAQASEIERLKRLTGGQQHQAREEEEGRKGQKQQHYLVSSFTTAAHHQRVEFWRNPQQASGFERRHSSHWTHQPSSGPTLKPPIRPPATTQTSLAGRERRQLARPSPALATARWSTGPLVSRLDALEAPTELADSEESAELKEPQRQRQSFVELLTCFCPCFSMC